MLSRLVVLLGLLLGLVACQTDPESRKPASQQALQILTEYYGLNLKLGQTSDRLADLVRRDEIGQKQKTDKGYRSPTLVEQKSLGSEIVKLKTQIQNQEPMVVQSVPQADRPISTIIPFEEKWRRHHDEFILHDLAPYLLKDGKIQKRMFVSNDARVSILQLSHFVFSWKDKNNTSQEMAQKYLKARLTCNQDVVIHDWPAKTKVAKNTTGEFKWFDKDFNGQRPFIEMNENQTSCDFTFSNPDHPQVYGIRIVPEDVELARIGNPHLQSEICSLPQTVSETSMQKFFLDPKMKYTTCPVMVNDVETLEVSTEGINAKIKMLTGQPVSAEFMKAANPFAPLDFSKAPQLDAILISYLVFRADFGGQLIMQALKYHAAKGTLIRIALSDVITLGKDRQMLFDLQAQYPNVKLLLYKFKAEKYKSLGEWISSFHRTNHIKLFLTYSKSQASANQAILGGRNIHDGFVFNQPTANYIYPTVVDYNPDGDESWARWEDFETRFGSPALIKKLMGQFFSVLHADYATVYVRSYTESVPSRQTLNANYFNLKDNEVYVRSLVSVPFKDNQLLEKTFIQMIDSAQKVLKVSTPYFNLTPGLFAAFERAADRGVDVQLITRLDLKGDTADIVLSDVNKKSVNKLYKKIQVYEYMTEGKILHSKLFIIDNQFVMMGSVNLNLRSFVHDLENATLVYGPGYANKISDLFEKYKAESKLLTDKQKTTFWKILLIKIIGTAL